MGKSMGTSVSFCFLMFTSGVAFTQSDNDLYIFTLLLATDGQYHVNSPKYLSGFNEGGITDQPFFTPSGDLLVSVRNAGEAQNDIWQLSPASKKIIRITSTKAGEFYPQISPDGLYLSFIRQDPTQVSDQRLYKVELHTLIEKCLSGDLHDIGNYAWMSSYELGLYRDEGAENSLNYLNTNDTKARRITTSVGQTLVADKSGHLIYIHKFNPEYWYVKKYSPASSSIEVVTTTPVKSDEIALSPDGTYFMGKDQILYSMNPSKQSTWNQVDDLSLYGIKYITGLAVSADGHQLALVATKQKP